MGELIFNPRYVADNCVSCGACVDKCIMLQRYVGSPKEYFENYSSRRDGADGVTAYYCLVCGLCRTVCPRGIDLGEAFLSVRGDMVGENHGRVPLKSLKSVNMHQRLSFCALFTAINRGGEYE